ncbi:hypothetical protein [Nocardioides soli]|uniref:Phage major capsid protein n=1 Tax=Nocardioides soli TaxID=1036020 RepID=A0A7W4Z143_9ACTN|nr:hypothetical protein [Nocardioides soli]MBB3041150.1 hypothetical protein [Nocardioides soli]
MSETVTFETTFAVDQESRTLSGVLLPFGVTSGPARDRVSGKVSRYQFAAGTVTVPDVDEIAVVLNYGHDNETLAAQVGIATHLEAKPDGVHAKFRIARTPEGDRVLALAEDRILRFFSAEVLGEFDDKDGVRHSRSAAVDGAAVVLKPAFPGAHITSVAASAAQEENTMECTKCSKVHAEGVTECATQAVAAAFTKADGDQLMEQVQGLSEKLAELEKIKIPVGPGAAQFHVTEEPIYRFAGTEPAPSGHDFATDLLAAARDGDAAAFARVQEFTGQYLAPTFADQPTTTADTAALNPSQYRPDMFLGQAPIPASPLYDFFYKGTRTDVTPFFWSKLDRANTDIGIADHTEGVDPEDRDLVTVVGDTVTPKPVSGKVHITREVADQGGNPVVSGLVWYDFERSFKVALEARTAALIQAATIAELGTAIPAGSTGTVAGAAVEDGLIGLQFLADGYRFQRAFGHVDLYKALAGATKGDDNADKLYPIINPENATGQAASKWAHLNIGGYGMYPAASLGATDVNQKSIVADPTAVHVWNSGLTRLDKLQESVEGWDLGVFAYWAGIVYDATGLRKITFDKSA